MGNLHKEYYGNVFTSKCDTCYRNMDIHSNLVCIFTVTVNLASLVDVLRFFDFVLFYIECIAKWCLISQYVTTKLSKAVKQDDRSLV